MGEKELEHHFLLGSTSWTVRALNKDKKGALAIEANSKYGQVFFIKDENEKTAFQEIKSLVEGKKKLLKVFASPDIDLDLIRHSKAYSQEESSLILPIFQNDLKGSSLSDNLRGVSHHDLNKIMHYEQVSALLEIAEYYGNYLETYSKEIKPESFEKYEFEWRLKDVYHETSSALLKASLKEEKKLVFAYSDLDAYSKDLIENEKKLLFQRNILAEKLKEIKASLVFLVQSLTALNEKDPNLLKLARSANFLLMLLEEKNFISEDKILKWISFDLILLFWAKDLEMTVLDCQFNQKNEGFLAFLLDISFISLKDLFSIDELAAFVFSINGKETESLRKIKAILQLHFFTALRESLNYYPTHENKTLELLDPEFSYLINKENEEQAYSLLSHFY
ncbi:hypothetical protein [Criblamydia sequanensis]|uniref:Uncharacterized protein n=1 Tax=Candidatus Criblamydia sequanensis CRIB-18 TaxID=1437425 RepID=A0A090DWR6_9BACT|nr:hypothetical protein [Criblamydia sequanensis]CDR33289.1 hypothetical protein CSEC_0452 [Criblamydia sequanensis CRIB-18]